MPHASVRLQPGVDTNETPALNETGFSVTNLIRFFYDRNGIGLPQKLGGWTRFFMNTISPVVRALWAWEDTEAITHLGVGTQNNAATYQSSLSVITNGNQKTITPRSQADNITAAVSTTSGDSIVTITDATITDITDFDTVYIPVHIAIGGLILFGLYNCNPDGHSATTTYTIRSVDALGNPLPASSSSTSPVVPQLTTVSGSCHVTVTLPGHGYNVGDIFPILVLTEVGGVSFYSHYPVQSVVDTDNFTILGVSAATSSTSGYINNDKARYIYSFGVGAVASGTGYGIGGYGRGGYGTGPNITPSTGFPVNARDWNLDNWGEVLVANPVSEPVVLTTTAASGNGTTGTLTFSQTYTVPVGDVVVVANVTPASWNGTYIVTASTSNSISFLTSVTSAQTGAGTITVQDVPFRPIYQWDAESGFSRAVIIPQAPPANDGIFVAMPQRQIVAWGSTFTGIIDPLLLRWCDVNNFAVWLGQITNQAGSFRIPKGSRIVACIQAPQQSLVWTDLGVWAMQYIGQPYIYSFNELGAGCGLIGRKAIGILNGAVYWMGPSQFFMLGGDGVQTIPCPVWDVAFQDLDQSNLDKIRVAVNSRFGEVGWYFPTNSSGGEIAAYVKLNVIGAESAWDYGSLARSAWIDQSVLGPPIGADPASGYIYQHETSNDADGQALLASFQTGYFATNEGDLKTFVDQVWPDMKWGDYGDVQNATVNLTFYTADYPGDMPKTYGPYALTHNTQFVTPRIRARLISIAMASNDVGSFWRLGNLRYRFSPDGKF